jgi:hypothetical protein
MRYELNFEIFELTSLKKKDLQNLKDLHSK